MPGRAFGPSAVTIAAVGTVEWRNDDDREHTVTAMGGDIYVVRGSVRDPGGLAG
jgi:plastocyanin